jgi:hypothetical protein
VRLGWMRPYAKAYARPKRGLTISNKFSYNARGFCV